MPTIVKIGNIKIRIFADDHHPPHFHIVTPDCEVAVRISDLSILAGCIDRRSFEIAMKWAKTNKGVLENEWNRLNRK